MDWSDLAQDRDNQLALYNMVMNLGFLTHNFLTNEELLASQELRSMELKEFIHQK
jgi:hypothetical protein